MKCVPDIQQFERIIHVVHHKVAFHTKHGLKIVRDVNVQEDIVLEKDISDKIDELLRIPFGAQENENAGKLKQGKSLFPFASFSALGLSDDYIMVYFETSFSKSPITFICDIQQKKVQNFLDIEVASELLNEDVFEQTTTRLHRYKDFQRVIPLINEIHSFVSEYKDIITEHQNELFEIECGDEIRE